MFLATMFSMKKRLCLLLFLTLTITLNAQELVPLSGNPVLQRYAEKTNRQLPKAMRNAKQTLTKNDEACPIENTDENYVFSGETLRIPIEIDTVGLGDTTGMFTCLECENLDFGAASVSNDTLIYQANAGIEGAKETVTVEFCNANGCRERTYPVVVRRRGQVHFQERVTLGPEGVSSVPANASLLPGRKAICSAFVECEDAYEGRGQEVAFDLEESPNRVLYQAGRYAGLDSVCVALCDTFAVCDTFKFAFRIINDTLTLPFMDDFSYEGPFPAGSHWLDPDAFVNFDISKEAPSLGAATFDGLDDEGQPYGGGYGEADFLTSKYIDLRGESGNVVLTYWLQRRGFGDRPEPADSMLLEFKNRDGEWVYQRSFEGTPTFLPTTEIEPFQFFQDTIPNEFKHAGFQFRFKNFSDRTGLLDIWNLDYVRVDNNFTDSIFNDIAFTRLPDFILKNYTSMPWRHFQEVADVELRDSLIVGIWNHANEALPASPSSARLREPQTNVELFDATLFNGIEANVENGRPLRRSYSMIDDPTGFPSVYGDVFQIMSGPAFDGLERQEFLLEYSFVNTSQVNTPGYEAVGRNNGVRRYTYFDNYFAYDDGTAEAGFIAQTNVQVAVQYVAQVEDSLRAVQFHFPHTTIDVSDQEFNLKIWIGELDDSPEYEQLFLRPIYTDLVFDTLQGFTTYVLEEPLFLPRDTFYVGWEQVTTCNGTKCIPIGYDRNSPQGKQFIFRNVRGIWEAFRSDPDLAFFPEGALMIRPVVGDETPPPTTSTDEVAQRRQAFKIFPNPARSVLNVQPEEGFAEDFHFQLFNATGQLLQQGVLHAQLDVSALPPGMYFLKIAHRRTNQVWNERVIIAK